MACFVSPKLLLKPGALALRTFPDSFHRQIFTQMLNFMFKGQIVTEQLHEIDGKRLCLDITDTRSQIHMRIQGQHLRPYTPLHPRDWEVCIRGDLEGFWRLATRAEDPDTLFFQRRLSLEGETEAGLYIKNMLDGAEFDWQAHAIAVLGPRLGIRAIRLIQRTGLDRLSAKCWAQQDRPQTRY